MHTETQIDKQNKVSLSLVRCSLSTSFYYISLTYWSPFAPKQAWLLDFSPWVVLLGRRHCPC